MTSPDPYFRDELDHLVKRVLNDRLGSREPPEYIWVRIKAQLETDEPSPRRLRFGWSPPAIQAALTLLVVVLVGIGLHTRLISGDAARTPSQNLSPTLTPANVDEHSVSPRVVLPMEEVDAGSLKVYLKLGAAHEIDAEPKRYPSAMEPLNVAPHPTNVERRSSSSLALAEQNELLHDGPCER